MTFKKDLSCIGQDLGIRKNVHVPNIWDYMIFPYFFRFRYLCLFSISTQCVFFYVFLFLFFPQRGFFSLPEGHYFIEPAPKSPDHPAGTPEPHIVYPRVTTEKHRKKRSLEFKETPSPCGVQGMYLNWCVYVCVQYCKSLCYCTQVSSVCHLHSCQATLSLCYN